MFESVAFAYRPFPPPSHWQRASQNYFCGHIRHNEPCSAALLR
jgi:hypothetical protein